MTSHLSYQIDAEENSVSNKTLNRIEIAIALLLVAGFFSYFKLSSQVIQEISFLALSIPASLLIRLKYVNINLAKKSLIFSLFYIIPIIVSYFVNIIESGQVDLKKVILLFNLVFSFYISSIFSSCKNTDFIKSILIKTSLFLLPILLYVIATQQNSYRWDRWEPFDIQPNWWGMMVLGFAWGVVLMKNPIIRFAGLTGSFLFMVALQSRGAIVALLPILFFSSGIVYPLTKRKIIIGVLTLLLMTVVIIISPIFLQKGIFERIMDYIYNDVFLINDPYRGLNTGLTGRTQGYALAWDAFLSSPYFGKGFGEYQNVHNGFLLVLAEGGILAFIGMLTIIGRGLWIYFKSFNLIFLGITLSYTAILLTFPRSFNINLTGILFIIVLMRSFAIKNIQKKLP